MSTADAASRSAEPGPEPIHAALIMDGNGRWARRRDECRSEGHRVGAEGIRELVRAAPELGIEILTLFAFSADNWNRPPDEVEVILGLIERYLRSEAEQAAENGVRIQVIGCRDRLPASLLDAIRQAEEKTRHGSRLLLRLAVDYSARERILEAVREGARRGGVDADGFAELLGRVEHDGGPAPDVDLLIRTGGEQRLSDFLLWECAYAEFVFTETPWPDFGPDDLAAAIRDFRSRDRRFGRVPGDDSGAEAPETRTIPLEAAS